MSCSELGQDQSKLKCSLSLSLILQYGERETPTVPDSTLKLSAVNVSLLPRCSTAICLHRHTLQDVDVARGLL